LKKIKEMKKKRERGMNFGGKGRKIERERER